MKNIAFIFILSLLGASAFAQTPKQVILAKDTQIPLVVSGKQVGSMTLKAGSEVNIVAVLPNNEGVMISKGDTTPTKVATDAITASSLAIATATPVPTPTPTPKPKVERASSDITISEEDINPAKLDKIDIDTDLTLTLAKSAGGVPKGAVVTDVYLGQQPLNPEFDYYAHEGFAPIPLTVEGVPKYKHRTYFSFMYGGGHNSQYVAQADAFTKESLNALYDAIEKDKLAPAKDRKFMTIFKLKTPSTVGVILMNCATLAKDVTSPGDNLVINAGRQLYLEGSTDGNNYKIADDQKGNYGKMINGHQEAGALHNGTTGWYLDKSNFDKATQERLAVRGVFVTSCDDISHNLIDIYVGSSLHFFVSNPDPKHKNISGGEESSNRFTKESVDKALDELKK